jgi:hypothetical protein
MNNYLNEQFIHVPTVSSTKQGMQMQRDQSPLYQQLTMVNVSFSLEFRFLSALRANGLSPLLHSDLLKFQIQKPIRYNALVQIMHKYR